MNRFTSRFFRNSYQKYSKFINYTSIGTIACASTLQASIFQSVKKENKNNVNITMDDNNKSKTVKDKNITIDKTHEEETRYAQLISGDNPDYDFSQHYYPKVINAELHPLVNFFLSLSINRIAERYCHLHPTIDKKALIKLLKQEPDFLRWSGADLFVTTTEDNNKQLTVIETNTCPSGQKSMPRSDQEISDGYGYKKLINTTFKPMLGGVSPELFDAGLAVIYDKNHMEASGYAQAMAEEFGETVHFVQFFNDDPNPPVRFSKDGIMSVRKEDGEWVRIRAAFRYVTQNPWDRIPVNTKTLILNPIIACISGGRNKNLAAKAYDIFNAKLQAKRGLTGLHLNTPETIKDVSFGAIPFMIKKFGGVGVIKSPYGNAGVDVFTITNEKELEDFMQNFGKENENMGRGYGKKFIVQTLIGNSNWSSDTIAGKFYHVGTVPDKKGNFYAADIRMMIHWDNNCWRPLCVYSRRAKEPLSHDLDETIDSWPMLGTNLSVKLGENDWKSDTNRLLIMDTRSFNKLGIGLDDLINGYIQSVLSTIAIDDLCKVFMNKDEHFDQENQGIFDFKMFSNLNPDKDILNDIKACNHI